MFRRRIRVLMAGALAVAGGLIWTALPVAATGALQVTFPPSPYTSCPIEGEEGTNYLDTEVESWVAVNPKDPLNVIGVWQQDRWSNGAARGLAAAASFDGGRTWQFTPLPFSHCAEGGLPYLRASDPWVSFGPDGTAYTVSLSTDRECGPSAIAAMSSTDGGRTWKNRSIVGQDGQGFLNDKESVTADPTRPGYAYVVWDKVTVTCPPASPGGDNLDPTGLNGPPPPVAFFARTVDGGATWSSRRPILSGRTVGHQIMVDPKSGNLLDFFDWIHVINDGTRFCTVRDYTLMTSADAGDSWSNPQPVVRHFGFTTNVVRHPNNPAVAVRTGNFIPEVAIDPVSGQLYMVWEDYQTAFSTRPDVSITTSMDGGVTWSSPPPGLCDTRSEGQHLNPPQSRAAFTPAVSVNSSGVVGVTYYDFRNLGTETSTLPTDYWFTSSSDGKTFTETMVSGPFDMMRAPLSTGRGFFVGDYQGLANDGKSFVAFFSQTAAGNPDDHAHLFVRTGL